MICKDMNGNKCAMEYCDFWNDKLQICNLALESKLNVDVAARKLKKIRAKTTKNKESGEAKEYSAKHNLVPSPKQLQ